MKDHLYHYRAVITRIVDGDTVEADIDMGANLWLHRQTLRLARIDAPEPRGPSAERGRVASLALAGHLAVGRLVHIHSHEIDSFGRWLAEIWLEGDNLSDWMLSEGHAVHYRKATK